jgi:hypothetical protein
MTSYTTTKNILLATDPGTEVDDFVAFSRAIELYDNTVNVSVIISGGKISPQNRMKILNDYINETHNEVPKEVLKEVKNGEFTLAIGSTDVVFRSNGAKFTFYADGDVGTLPPSDVFIGNGPLNRDSLIAVANAMKGGSSAFLIGGREVGGVNQAGTNPPGVTNNWPDFIRVLDMKKVNIVEMLPETTRLIRFKPVDFKGDLINNIAMRTTLMFMASLPTIPPKYGDFDLHVRLNEANAQLCEIWKKEMSMVFSSNAMIMGTKRVKEYIYILRSMGHISDNASWIRLENLAQTCLTMTYAFAEKVFGRPTEVYANHKFGFSPEAKLNKNPGHAFATAEMAQILSNGIKQYFLSFTPTYDVQSVEACHDAMMNPSAKIHDETVGATQDLIVILDDSGSMSSMGNEPLESLNGFIKEQQADGDPNTTFSLWMFNTEVRKILDDVKLSDVKPVTEYNPQNMTALNDALGAAIICKLAKSKSDNVVCLVITDGLENSSSSHTKSGIRDMIKTCEKEKNWKFIFMGANQDVFKEGSTLGFSPTRCTSYNQQCPGNLRTTSHEVSDSVLQYRTSTRMSVTPEHIELSLNKISITPISCTQAPSLGLRQKTRVEVISQKHSLKRDTRQSPLF